MQYESYTTRSGTQNYILDDFDRYNLLEFGPKLRFELIKKWNALGQSQLEINELIRLNNDSEAHVDPLSERILYLLILFIFLRFSKLVMR